MTGGTKYVRTNITELAFGNPRLDGMPDQDPIYNQFDQ